MNNTDWQDRVSSFCGLYGMEKSRVREWVVGLENDFKSLIDASYKRGVAEERERLVHIIKEKTYSWIGNDGSTNILEQLNQTHREEK